MPNDFSRSEVSFRIRQLSAALRDFGLVDNYGLSSLLYGSKRPTKAKIEQTILGSKKPLRLGLTAEAIASAIYRQLSESPPHVVRWNDAYGHIRCNLQRITAGKKDAKIYHQHIAELLTAAFDGLLSNTVIEQPMDGRRKFVDITFDNDRSRGFFVSAKTAMKCDYVYFECKNYSLKLGNKEYDQIAGRLNGRRGLLGFVVCRKVANKRDTLAHCLDRYTGEGKCIIVLDDDDIRKLFNARKSGNLAEVNLILKNKYRAIVMGASK